MQYGGVVCEGPPVEQELCEDQPCAVDCVMSPWDHGQNACSKECGGGKITETRTIEVTGG